MTYELAKELKDEDFPQEGDFWMTKKAGICYRPLPEDREYLVPTLEELIEACGEEFCLTTLSDGTWKVLGRNIATTGSTHVIAVARLWLALNKRVVK